MAPATNQDGQDDAVQVQAHESSLSTLIQQNEVSQPSAKCSDCPIPSVKDKKRKAVDDEPAQPAPKQAKTDTTAKSTTSVGRKPKVKAKGKSSGGDEESSPKSSSVDPPKSSEKPLFSLRDIIRDLLDNSQSDGLHHYVQSGRQFCIQVGTLCSGTDAPVHAMDLFGMLKNDQGDQVFTTVNRFGCEIEPFKQNFIMRNSKPQLLFRDARDFSKDGARHA